MIYWKGIHFLKSNKSANLRLELLTKKERIKQKKNYYNLSLWNIYNVIIYIKKMMY